jgi:hypothetical protein
VGMPCWAEGGAGKGAASSSVHCVMVGEGGLKLFPAALGRSPRTLSRRKELLELTWVLAEFIALRKVIYVLGIPYGGHAHV